MPAQENITIKIVNNTNKLSKWFEIEFPNCAYSSYCAILRKKDIKVNGRRVSKDLILKKDDIVEIFCAPSILNGKYLTTKIKIDIIYDDENVVIINKPDNIEVEGANSITSILCERFNTNLLLVHRLDRNTCGLLIFAKKETVLADLIDATKNNQIEKHYLTWVKGQFNHSRLIAKAFLFKDSKKSLSIISKDYKLGYVPIETQIKLIKKEGNKSLLEVVIHNGKTHQIRAHLAFLGYPIIGDGKYNYNSNKDKQDETKEATKNNTKIFKHQLLLAYRINFKLNKTNKLAYLNNCNIKLNIDKFIDIFDK